MSWSRRFQHDLEQLEYAHTELSYKTTKWGLARVFVKIRKDPLNGVVSPLD